MTAGLIVSTSTPCSMADGIRRDAVSPDSRRGLLWQPERRCRHLITIVPLQQLSQSRFRVGNYSNGVGLEIEARARAHPDIPGISRRHTTTRSAWRSWSWPDCRPQPPLNDTQAKGEIEVGADEQHEQPRAPEDAARPFEEWHSPGQRESSGRLPKPPGSAQPSAHPSFGVLIVTRGGRRRAPAGRSRGLPASGS